MSPGSVASAFGALLRAHRRAIGLTQVELAQRAGLGVRTVRDIEHGKSARPQRTTVELLARALELSPAESADFLAVARGVKPAEKTTPAVIRLPLPIELIGRERDITSLVAHLGGQPGLTTLVGLAGVGKSALSLAAAHRAEIHFPHNIAGISIAAGDTAADISEGISAVLGVGRPAELAERLEEPVLLVVDGIDRASDSAREALRKVLAELIAQTPKLRVLASAREPLELAGETVWPVGPLALPPEGVTTLTEAQRHPSSALFLARWNQVRSQAGHQPASSDDEIPALIALVRGLGGLPLAIELAAARGRVLDPPEMLARYGNRLLDLGGSADSAPTMTLRDVVTASYRLLDPGQRRVLRRLAIFGYRWSIELAEEMAGSDLDVVPVLERLVELGLVQIRGSGAFRFMLLDVVRAFALEQAEAAGELHELRMQHGVIFARFAARTAPELSGSTLAASVARLDDVATDLWAALTHAAEHDPHTALCLASKLPRWWRFRGRDREGQVWLERLLADERTADAEPTVWSWAELGVAQLAAEHGAGQSELYRAESALRDFQTRADVTGELAARSTLLAIHQVAGSYDQAREQGEAALILATRTGRVRDMAIAQNNLIWHDMQAADLATAQRRLAAVDRLSARSGEHQLRALARANLAEVLRLDGRYDESIRVGRQAVELLAEVGHPGQRRRILGVIGVSYALAGQVDPAEKTLGELRALLPDSSSGDPGEDWDSSMIEATLARGRGQLALAASWYEEAAASPDADPRDIAEALVGLTMTSPNPTDALARLKAHCAEAHITLTTREQAELDTHAELPAHPTTL